MNVAIVKIVKNNLKFERQYSRRFDVRLATEWPFSENLYAYFYIVLIVY